MVRRCHSSKVKIQNYHSNLTQTTLDTYFKIQTSKKLFDETKMHSKCMTGRSTRTVRLTKSKVKKLNSEAKRKLFEETINSVSCQESANEQVNYAETEESISVYSLPTSQSSLDIEDSDGTFMSSSQVETISTQSTVSDLENGSDQLQQICVGMEFSQCRGFISNKTGPSSSPIAKIPIEREVYETNSQHSNAISPSKAINIVSNTLVKPPLEGRITLDNMTPVKRKLIDDDTTPKKRVTGQSNKEKMSPKQQKLEGKSLFRLTHVNVMKEMIESALEKRAYQPLFSEVEKNILQNYNEQPPRYQYFIFKLFLYLPKWYNVYDICKKIDIGLEDSEIKSMYEQLHSLKMIDLDIQKEDIPTLLSLLQQGDLKHICTSFRIKMQNYTRDKMIERLLKICTAKPSLNVEGIKTNSEILIKRVKEKLGYCVKLEDQFREILRKVYLLHTFTNQDFLKPSDYFYRVVDLSAVFPCYLDNIEDDFRLFYSQEDFNRYARTQALKYILIDALDKKNDKTQECALEIGKKAFEELKNLSISDCNNSLYEQYPHLKYYTARCQYVNILNMTSAYLISKDHLTVKNWLLYLLEQKDLERKFAGWYHQMAIIYENYLKKYDLAARFLLKGLKCKSDITEIELEDIAIRGRRLKDSAKHKIAKVYHDRIVKYLPEPPDKQEFPTCSITAKAIRSNTPGRKRHYLIHIENGDKEFIAVEDVALNYYKEQNYPTGIHCEGGLASVLFCLLFYDIIYELYVPHTFLSKVQTCPLDFHTKYFYKNREAAINERLKNIFGQWTDEELRDFLIDKYKHSHETSFCNMELFTCDLLLSVIACIGRPVLSKILERLATNYRVYRSGMPDLFVWNSENKTCKFVEVKGEKDKLSTKQKFWLKYLRSIGADIEVCLVDRIGSKMKKPVKNKTS